MKRAAISTLIMMWTLSVCALAWAEPPTEHGHGDHHLGVRVALGQGLGSHATSGVGCGLMGEHHLVGPLEFEWVGQLDRHGAELVATESVGLKAPWHLTEHVDLFVGAGARTSRAIPMRSRGSWRSWCGWVGFERWGVR